MTRPHKFAERSLATFLFALLAFSPAILNIFSVEVFPLGVPLLYLYLFVVWAVIIGLTAWIAEWGAGSAGPGQPGAGRDDERGTA